MTRPHPSLPLSGTGSRGFSLMELLAAMVLLAVLLVFLLPVFTRSARKADMATCGSNLRQIGLAVHYYIQENGGWCPGPIGSSVKPYTKGKWIRSPSGLLDFIYPNLSLPMPGMEDSAVAEIFRCPATRKLLAERNLSLNSEYFEYKGTRQEDGSTLRPFGYTASDSPTVPRRKLSEIRNPAGVFVLGDRCKPLGSDATTMHGPVRNILYLDGHVELSEP